MKLFVTGGGDSHHFTKIDQAFINELGSDPKLLFIPLAGKKKSWGNGLDRIQQTFSTIRFSNIEMCTNLHELSWKYLKQFNAIYFDGGNTFQLMSMIRDTHTYELLHRFLKHGGVINGDSAGAIVLGSHLETAHFGTQGDENKSEVYSYQGLNLLGRIAIHCHYNEEEDKEIISFVNQFGFPVLALHENSGAYICDSLMTVIGENKISLFNDGKRYDIKPNDSRSLKDFLLG